MREQRSRVAVAATMVLSLVASGVTMPEPASAEPDLYQERERVEEEMAEAAAVLEHATEQAKEAASRYAEANASLPPARARVDEATGQVVAAQVRARTASRDAEAAERELAAASDRFEDSTEVLDSTRDQVAAFAVAAYKGGSVATFNLLLQARDPAQVVERLGYVDRISTIQRDALDEMSGARLAARQAENDAQVAQARTEAARAEAQTALDTAELAREAAEAAAEDVESLAEQRSDALAEAQAQREESLTRYEQAEADAERITEQLRQWEAEQAAEQASADRPATSAGGGALAMPTQGWLSSGYGMRHDPFFDVWQLHAGVDIAAPGGTPVYAASDGTVMHTGWYGGYGNFTCLSHGGHGGQALSTCYAHQSAILVDSGQWVRRGEMIGRVGTTGASTGDHLHFEVRLDGSPTNPVEYLPGF